MNELEPALRLLVAGLSGMAIGLEREWSGHASGPDARFAGVRTFTLIGGIGGVSGWLLDENQALAAAVLLLGAAALTVAAYAAAARRGPEAIDGTTETSALLVLGIGVLAGLGWLRLASGAAAVTVMLLREKEAIRRFVRRIGDAEMRAALQFAVLALVILPLLPEGPLDQFGGIRPRGLWAVVLVISGLNFGGYLARRALGDARGYPVMGALGGLVSSTAVALTFSQQSRKDQANAGPLALGVLAACTVLIPRILAITFVLNRQLLPAAALGCAPILAAGIVLVLIRWRELTRGKPATAPPAPKNPLQLGSAIQMAVGFQLVLWVLAAVSERFGEAGVLASATLLGLTDMDALTFGMSRLADSRELVVTAARALALGVTVNTVFKTVVVATVGTADLRRAAVPGLTLLALAGASGFWLVGRLLSGA
ncbi:MAG: MgtC/SapB family protein [Gemmatimonadales bacterium]|nr:MgtC/SapB family protein [Gemmatimonadales bacterium]